MQPPRRPKESDYAKRKAELEAGHDTAASTAAPTAEELSEADRIFENF